MQPERPNWCGVEATTLFVRGVEVEAAIGVYPYERRIRQPLRIDVELSIGGVETDVIEATFDYAQIPEIIAKVASDRHFNLIESFAEQLGRFLLQQDRVEKAIITIAKPGALAASAASTGVRLAIARL